MQKIFKSLFVILTISIFLLSACSGIGGAIDMTSADDGTRFSLFHDNVQAGNRDNITEGHGDNVTVSRALAAKMLTMALYDLQTINLTDREITFIDTSVEDWFDRYINAAYVHNLMTGVGDTFLPNSPVTLSQAQVLIDRLDSNNTIRLEITPENRDRPVSYALFADLFRRALINMSGDSTPAEAYGVIETTFVVLATFANSPQLGRWNVITDNGPVTSFGINLSNYIDKEVRVLIKDGDILAVLGVESETPTIRNAFVVRTSENEITIFSGGAERTYSVDSTAARAGDICDITISGEKAIEIVVHSEIVTDVINRISQDEVEFKNIGTFPLDKNFKVYVALGGAGGIVRWRQINNLLVGTDIAEFRIRDGVVLAAVIVRNTHPEKLRVLIGTTGFTGRIHSSVTVSATREFKISNGLESTTYAAWEAVVISDEMWGEGNRLYVSTDPDGKIVIPSIRRNYPNNESPRYRGMLEISRRGGGYIIINEVDFEEYLYAVVPSEMPSSFGIPAAKVQAITARSYAFNQFFANRFYSYGANIDDSVISQVYNNIPENEVSIAAVNATRGQFLAYNGSIVSANFFSTSGGTTANSGEVWSGGGRQFPTSSPTYLTAGSQLVDRNADLGDMTQEDVAAAFFKDTTINAFDSDSQWFRWNVTMTAEEISASVNHSLESRFNANPSLIRTLQSDGVFRSKPISNIGAVLDIAIRERGEGGNILSMIINGERATILVETEFNIRLLLAPVQRIPGGSPIALNLADGSVRNDYALMPSAFYTIDKSFNANGNLISVRFHGGGNGHGVGMSQHGAKGMLDLGYTVEQVLRHFYPGTEIVRLN